MMFNIAGVVLAGGKSSRMGSDKKELTYKGNTFLNLATTLLKNAGCNTVYVSLAKNVENKTNIIKDNYQNIGALSGVISAIEQIKSDYIVFIPTDMPLLQPNIINHLMLHINKEDMAIYYEAHIFPFIIKSSPHVVNIINIQIAEEKFSLKQLLNKLNAKSIPFKDNEKYLQNINYKEEYLRLKHAN